MGWDPDEIEELEARTTYRVVVNQEGQYSIWPIDNDIPLGWNEAGKSGTKDECLRFIDETWTDMRPLSLQRRMREQN
jgi:MbtH protein